MEKVAGPYGGGRIGLGLRSLAPFGCRILLPARGVEREPEVEMDESAAGMGGRERTKPLEGPVGPGGDGCSHSRLERRGVVPENCCELRPRLLGLAAVIGPLGRAERLRLGVVSEKDAQLECRRLARRAVVAATDEGNADDDGCRDDGGNPDDQPDSGTGRHSPNVARAASAACTELLYFVKLWRPTASSCSGPSPRSTKSTPRRRRSCSPRTPSQSSTCASARSGTRATSPAPSTSRAATWSLGSKASFPTGRARSSSTAPPGIAPRSQRRPSRSSGTRTSPRLPAASRTGSGTASPTRFRRLSTRTSAAATAATS